MSSEVSIILVLVALALAVQSVRVLVDLAPDKRLGRLAVLTSAALLGLWVVHSLAGWDYAALGCVGGLAVVELGPTVAAVVRGIVRRKGGEQ